MEQQKLSPDVQLRVTKFRNMIRLYFGKEGVELFDSTVRLVYLNGHNEGSQNTMVLVKEFLESDAQANTPANGSPLSSDIPQPNPLK